MRAENVGYAQIGIKCMRKNLRPFANSEVILTRVAAAYVCPCVALEVFLETRSVLGL